MTTIIKYGSTAIQDMDDLARIRKQIEDRKGEPTVVVTVALGDTTDLIAKVLHSINGKKGSARAEQVFGRYFDLVRKIDDRGLSLLTDGVLRHFDSRMHVGYTPTGEVLDEMTLALGDRLTAHMLHAYLSQSGVPSMLIDTRDYANRNPAQQKSEFPLILKAENKSVTIDMEATKTVAQDIRQAIGDNHVMILPGYIGTLNGSTRTLGRGGGDTAAFVYANAFGANFVQIVADDALTTAPRSSRVVDEIDLEEAWAAGFFGARLRTYRSAEYLGQFLEEHPQAHVYITDKEMGPRKTRINTKAKPRAVRFVASRHVSRYGIEGDWRGIISQLYRDSAIDWFLLGGMPNEVAIAVAERGSDLAAAMIKKAELRGEVRTTYNDDVAFVGVVGSGMRTSKGIANRAYRALQGVNISRTYDPDVKRTNSSSIGIMVAARYEREAVDSLHREFFQNGK